MRARTLALQLGRVLVLLALLRATGWFVDDMYQAQTRMAVEELWGPWAGLSLVSLLFVAVMLLGRRRWHPWAVLALEAAVAAVIAFVPPLQWLLWFSIGGWTTAMVGGTVQPLAVAWLGVVVLSGVHQRHGRHPPPRDGAR